MTSSLLSAGSGPYQWQPRTPSPPAGQLIVLGVGSSRQNASGFRTLLCFSSRFSGGGSKKDAVLAAGSPPPTLAVCVKTWRSVPSPLVAGMRYRRADNGHGRGNDYMDFPEHCALDEVIML